MAALRRSGRSPSRTDRASVSAVGTGGRWDRSWAEAPSDGALIAAVGDQNHEALSEIYRRHGGAVWSVARRICSRAGLAEDVCETVFTDLWSHPERFDPARSALRSWLVAQAHSRAVAAMRSQDGRRPQEVAAHAGALSDEARVAIDQLAPIERESILLTYIGGHTYSEAARLLGVPGDTVKSSMRRGLLNLRRIMEAEGASR
jgi:RNA polymerase sigma-70 factor (ECF subfamily)